MVAEASQAYRKIVSSRHSIMNASPSGGAEYLPVTYMMPDMDTFSIPYPLWLKQWIVVRGNKRVIDIYNLLVILHGSGAGLETLIRKSQRGPNLSCETASRPVTLKGVGAADQSPRRLRIRAPRF